MDGKWIAWFERESIAVEHIAGDEAPLQVSFREPQPWSYMLRTVDMEREELELTGPNRRVLLDLQGKVKSAEPLLLSWDRYRDDGPPQVSWNANGQAHTHHVLRGRLTNSVAMTPAGDLIAISVGTGLNIGRIRDSIYVLRTADETEVFRRYLPMYTRTPIFFPTDNLMVYAADGQVIVLRIAR